MVPGVWAKMPLWAPGSAGPKGPNSYPCPGPGSTPATPFCLHRFVVSCTPSWFWGPVITLEDCLAAFFAADELKGEWTGWVSPGLEVSGTQASVSCPGPRLGLGLLVPQSTSL